MPPPIGEYRRGSLAIRVTRITPERDFSICIGCHRGDWRLQMESLEPAGFSGHVRLRPPKMAMSAAGAARI
jgi:hypothetical protein